MPSMAVVVKKGGNDMSARSKIVLRKEGVSREKEG